MDLRFLTPELRRLDQAATEVLVATLQEDERPPRGLAGLLDWRLAGRISRVMHQGFARGRFGEVLLLPAKPRLPFDKVVLFGIGMGADFEERAYRQLIERMLTTLAGLRARTAVVELPGRHNDLIDAPRAVDILLEYAETRREHDVWTLVEPLHIQKILTQRLLQERRRGAL